MTSFILGMWDTRAGGRGSPRGDTSTTGSPVDIRRRLPLHGAGQARHVVLDEEGIHDGDGDGAQQGPGHELAPEVDVTADQLRDHTDRHRFLLGRGEKDERVDELVPGQGEREDAGRQDAGYGDGEDDPEHRPEARGSVDPRALLELLRNGL